jgi:hypothetical protein
LARDLGPFPGIDNFAATPYVPPSRFMNNTRRTLFAVLVVGCLIGLTQALGLRPSTFWLSSTLFLIGLVSPFGLLIWSAVVMERDKTLTRVALAMVFFFMLALCIVIARLPS